MSEEWVDKEIRDELIQANREIKRLRDVNQKLSDLCIAQQLRITGLLRSLADPPHPWETFGSNINTQEDVIFWGDDGTGLPIWERFMEEEE